MLSYFANPHRFMALSKWLLPIFGVLGGLMMISGWAWALTLAPEDLYQGPTARIMHIHVPAAWVSLMAYGVMAVASLLYLTLKHSIADVAAKAAAPAAAAFAFICLVTGSLWGRPTWGTYWIWDARLTSMLFQLFLILGYMALRSAFQREQDGARAGAILCLVGAINLPIIKFSVEWWNSLHQTSSIMANQGDAIDMCGTISDAASQGICESAVLERSFEICTQIGIRTDINTCLQAVQEGFGMPIEFLMPLLYNAIGASFAFGAFLLAGMRAEITNRQYEAKLARLNRSGS